MKRKSNKLKYLIYLTPILFCCFFVIMLVNIQKIECVVPVGECPRDIIIELNKFTPSDYLKSKKQIKNYLNSNKYVKSYFIQFKLPDILKVSLELKPATFALFNESQNEFVLANGEYEMVDLVKKTNLNYVVTSNLNYTKGNYLNDKSIFAIKILEKLNWIYGLKYIKLNNQENLIEVKLNDKINAIIPTEGDIDYLIGSLRIIFSRLNENEEGTKMNNITQIDLRYKNPILR